jgi:hypothetical protein
MSALTNLRAAAISLIRGIAIFKSVKPHVGRYTIDDLKRLHAASPSCAVGIVNASKPVRRASGEVALDVTFAAVIVTRAGNVLEADDQALDLAVSLTGLLAAWVPAAAVPKVTPAAGIHLEGVGDDEIDNAGLVVWAVMWTHTVTVGADLAGADIDTAHRLGANPRIEVTQLPPGTGGAT